MKIASVRTALAPHRYDQETIFEVLGQQWSAHPKARRFDQLRRSAEVQSRHLALPLERYFELDNFGEANEAYLKIGGALGQQALSEALAASGVPPQALNHLFSVTVTGVATPSLDAGWVNRLGLRGDIKRSPIFGLGCVAGASGIARAADYLRGHPDEHAALVSVELCTLTFQKRELSAVNLIATSLFADGAAAVVLSGRDQTADGPEVLGTRACFYPDSEDAMGWQVGAEGFRLVLSREVPELIRQRIRGDIEAFLAEHSLTLADIGNYVLHPGGPKILTAVQQALDLPDAALAASWSSLRRIGNLSSASVLAILQDTWDHARPDPGTLSLLGAMGPGFCSEWVLLRW